MKDIEWTEASLEDMAALDKGIARRVKQAVERFAESGAGNVKKLQGIDPPEYRIRVATTGSVSNWMARHFAFSACVTAAKPIAEIFPGSRRAVP